LNYFSGSIFLALSFFFSEILVKALSHQLIGLGERSLSQNQPGFGGGTEHDYQPHSSETVPIYVPEGTYEVADGQRIR
jgi:hypothetical protein